MCILSPGNDCDCLLCVVPVGPADSAHYCQVSEVSLLALQLPSLPPPHNHPQKDTRVHTCTHLSRPRPGTHNPLAPSPWLSAMSAVGTSAASAEETSSFGCRCSAGSLSWRFCTFGSSSPTTKSSFACHEGGCEGPCAPCVVRPLATPLRTQTRKCFLLTLPPPPTHTRQPTCSRCNGPRWISVNLTLRPVATGAPR